MSGTIRLITNKPNLTSASGTIEANLIDVDGGGVGYDLNATANVPIVQDRLALRATGYVTDSPGYIKNIETGAKDINSETAYGGRVELLGQVNSALELNLEAIYQYSNPKFDNRSLYSYSGSNPYVYTGEAPSFARTSYGTIAAGGVYSFNNLKLTATTTASHRTLYYDLDGTGYAAFVASAFFGQTNSTPVILFTDTSSDIFTDEVRLQF